MKVLIGPLRNSEGTDPGELVVPLFKLHPDPGECPSERDAFAGLVTAGRTRLAVVAERPLAEVHATLHGCKLAGGSFHPQLAAMGAYIAGDEGRIWAVLRAIARELSTWPVGSTARVQDERLRLAEE